MSQLEPSPLCTIPCASRQENTTASRKRKRLDPRRSAMLSFMMAALCFTPTLPARSCEACGQQRISAAAQICKDDDSGLRRRTSNYRLCKSLADQDALL